MTPSERRLHPLSFLFVIAGQLRQLVVPLLVVLVGAGRAGLDWQGWAAVFIVPYAIVALVRTMTFRYRFEPSELVMTSGLLFRNERHVPYSRIQNIDAVQNLLHRAAKVADVKIETGGGDEPEAKLSVLSMSALDEIRARVFAGRAATVPRSTDPNVLVGAEAAVERRSLVALGFRELLLAGFVDSRGMIIVGAAFGLLWEVGLFDRTLDMVFGEDVDGRGLVRQVFRALFGGGWPSLRQMGIVLLSFLAFLLVIRLLSMVWSLIRLWGFRLDRAGDDLSAQYGFFTRVMMTIPVRRIQTLTVRQGPLHRAFDTVSIRVESAGGDGGAETAATKESLAPILKRVDLTRVLADMIPDVNVDGAEWRPVDPRGFGRAFRGSVVLAVLGTIPVVQHLRWWSLAWFAALVVWAWFNAKLYVKHLGWAVGEHAVFFRSGYLWREMTVARFNKIQVVTLGESPFDRRTKMASISVDTAGAANASHHVSIPYLSRGVAAELFERLSAEAARTQFRW